MSAIRSRNNRTEVALRQALHARGLRFRLHPKAIYGKPDIVFPREKVAVFVDGDFWHARALRERGMDAFQKTIRTPSQAYWMYKFSRRIVRDDDVSSSLRSDGWTVLRFWESELKKDVAPAAGQIARVVTRLRRKIKSQDRTANR